MVKFHFKQKQSSYQYENMFNMLRSYLTYHRSTIGKEWVLSTLNIMPLFLSYSFLYSSHWIVLNINIWILVALLYSLSIVQQWPMEDHERTVPYSSQKNSLKCNSKILKAFLHTSSLLYDFSVKCNVFWCAQQTDINLTVY